MRWKPGRESGALGSHPSRHGFPCDLGALTSTLCTRLHSSEPRGAWLVVWMPLPALMFDELKDLVPHLDGTLDVMS